MEVLAGRKKFDKDLHKENDPKGKQIAIRILANSLLCRKFHYRILTPKEDFQCGDVKLKSKLDDSVINFEIECSGDERFDKNFDGYYSTVNVPLKDFKSIPDDFFISVDPKDADHPGSPMRFYMIKVSDIVTSPKKCNVNKHSDGKLEYFYKVPSKLVNRYEWSQKYGQYKLVKL